LPAPFEVARIIATSPTLATPFLKNFLKKINHLELPCRRFLSSEGANYTDSERAPQALFYILMKKIFSPGKRAASQSASSNR
ncbi:hypothetical protein, partial [Microbulbifer thermotolerans]|uniref:hypothetical protein n=1 Tax=Microbulbifer thermotolerans TaxID=252514 RepID=UPI00224A5873